MVLLAWGFFETRHPHPLVDLRTSAAALAGAVVVLFLPRRSTAGRTVAPAAWPRPKLEPAL